MTRPHDDVDLTVWRDDYPEIRRLLELAAWRYEPVDDEAIGAGFRSGTVLLELTLVVSDDHGQIFIPFPGEPGLWSTEPFGEERGELGGVTCRLVPRAFLLAGKAVLRDAPDAAKDRADFAALSGFREGWRRADVTELEGSPRPGGTSGRPGAPWAARWTRS